MDDLILSGMAQDSDERRIRALETSNEELREFVSTIAHDLQESVRKVQVFTGRLADRLEGGLDEASKKDLERVRRGADRLANQIEGLLEYSRVSTRGKAFERVDLREVIAAVEEVLAEPIARTGARIEIASSCSLEADRDQMVQLFGHLIRNSLKFRKPEAPPLVKIKAFEQDPTVRIEVQDEGVGFDSRFSGQLFKVFARLHPSSQYEGVGTGLAICRRIVERHGGEITARGEPGSGSVFSVRLPRRRVEDVSTDSTG